MKRIWLFVLLAFVLSLMGSQITNGPTNLRKAEFIPTYLPLSEKSEIVKPVKMFKATDFHHEFFDSSLIFEEVFEQEYVAFEINTEDTSVQVCELEYTLPESAQLAVELAPRWLRPSLKAKFRDMDASGLGNPFGALVVNAPENLRDEIAFLLSHMSRQSLTSTRFLRDYTMPVRNAELIYALVDSLPYVRLVEHEGDDYYTTIEYRVVDEGDSIWVEAPRDIYYWFVVHPKLSDEGVYSDDDAGASQQRTYDYFWREYLWFNPNPDYDFTNGGEYPLLNERLKNCEVLWAREAASFPNSADTVQWAASAVGIWVSSMMPGTPGPVRPIQPNQLAYIHAGNCGEGQDISGAALRTALIPQINVCNIAEDHVWNEFWDEDWVFYQVDNHGGNAAIASGWGGYDRDHGGSKDISTVWAYRGDGYIMQVTEHYSAVGTLQVNITDNAGEPIDGAYMLVANESFYDPEALTYCTLCWSDANGQIILPIGDAQNYYAKVYTPFGNWPPGEDLNVNLLVDSSEPGEYYDVDIEIAATMMSFFEPSPMEIEEPLDLGVHIQYNIKDVIIGKNSDLDSQDSEFHYESGAGKGYFFLTDETGLGRLRAGLSFDAYYYDETAVSEGSADIWLPSEGIWYAVFWNNCWTNHQKVEAECYLTDMTGIKENVQTPEELSIGAYPNPFNSTLNIDLPENTKSVEIYTVDGKLVDTIIPSGLSIKWQAEEANTGVYLIKAHTPEKEISQRVLLIK